MDPFRKDRTTETETSRLPAPVALTAAEMRAVAAGTAMAMYAPVTAPLLICGGIRVPAATAMTVQ